MAQISKSEGSRMVIYGDNRTTLACIPILDQGISLGDEDLEVLEAMAKRLSSSERR